MVFSSTIFLFCFLPLVLIASLVAPRRLQNALLLAASLFFYAWGETVFVGVMLASIGVNFFVGKLIAARPPGFVRRLALFLGVAFNLLLLCVFKYANFLVDEVAPWVADWGYEIPAIDPIHLPIGISFFTFQALSYLVDVARKDAEVQRDPIDFALFIALFPQLIAGPIVRYREIATQLSERRQSMEEFSRGIERFIIGLGKKVLIANTLGNVADDVFALSGSDLGTAVAWTGILCYTGQIYFDFSGYSDMAIGLGRCFGFRLPENFAWPYIARSITEFWRRWHQSLSRWFRDYLYIPLGGNRRGPFRTYFNLIIVFLLCGLWHGPSWNFAIWGLYHGLFLVIERLGFLRLLDRWPAAIRHLYVMLVVIVGWVPFKADTLEQSGEFLAALFGWHGHGLGLERGLDLWDRELSIVGLMALLGATPLVARIMAATTWRRDDDQAPPRWGVLGLLARPIAMVFLLGVLALALVSVGAGTQDPFIYFRF